MSDRNGATLIEVLVAIFVMGIGLLALLTLFPLGVLRMAQAIQDEHCAQCSRIAAGTANFQGVRNDPWVLNLDPNTPTVVDPFSDPKWDLTTWPVAFGPPKTADPDGPSYPVFVDPLGYYQTSRQAWLTLIDNSVRRRTVSFVQTNFQSGYRWFSLLDDIIFATDPNATGQVPFGTPELIATPPAGTPGAFNRDTRYSWAYMLKRPRTADRSVVDLTVAVFKNRAISATTGTLSEFLYQTQPGSTVPSATGEVTMRPTANTISIDVSLSGNSLPPARPGDWLLDASYVPSAANSSYATVNGYFYRVVGVTEDSPQKFTYEVQQPLRNFPATAITLGNPATAWQKIIYLDGLVAVYEKGAGKLP